MAGKSFLVFILVVFCCLFITWKYYTSVKWPSVDVIANGVNFSYFPNGQKSRQSNRNKFHEDKQTTTRENMTDRFLDTDTKPSKQKNASLLRQEIENNHSKGNTTFSKNSKLNFLTSSPADGNHSNTEKIRDKLLKGNFQPVSKFDDATVIPLQIFDKQVVLYTAILNNSSNTTPWDTLVIQAWEHIDFEDQGYYCCIKYRSRTIRKTPVSIKLRRRFNVPYLAVQFFCNLSNTTGLQKDLPAYVTLISDNTKEKCPNKDNLFIKIEYAYQHPGKLAVYAKVIYGNISAVDLLAWFEIHRLMGADIFVFYVYRVNENVTKVLRYYQNLGVAEAVPFKFFNSSNVHDFRVLHFNDECMTLSDAFERLQGYRYLLHIDIDEYLVPTKNENLPSMFDRLTERYPDAAGFSFSTYLYVTSWGQTSNLSLFTVGQYLNRTVSVKDRIKHFILPTRVKQGGYKSHLFLPKRPFQAYDLPESEAVVRHYRKCRQGYSSTDKGCYDFKRFKDDYLYSLFKPIEKRVLRLKQQLGI